MGEEKIAAEEERFDAIVAAIYPSLVRRLTLVLGDHAVAEDVAQAALLRGFEAWSPGAIREPRAWIYTIAMRLALNEKRRRRHLGPFPFDGRSEMAGDPDLWAALSLLGTYERVSLVMNALEGYTQAEIAARLGVPEGSVASWLSRGKAKLRQRLTIEE
jgi:RNA polymerase sigma-70 factor, ECF subfamily